MKSRLTCPKYSSVLEVTETPWRILSIKYLPDQIVTSALTSLQVLVVPLRDGDVVLAAQYGALRTSPAGQ